MRGIDRPGAIPAMPSMGELDDLRTNLRQLIELERASGVEWLPMPRTSAPSTSAPSAVMPITAATQTNPRREDEYSPPVAVAATPARSAPEQPLAQDRWTAPADLIEQPAALALPRIATDIAACQRCGLCATRKQTVPGEGNPTPAVVFVGEGPGQEEDETGRPFVGAAGHLLDRMIIAMGLSRSEVFIVNAIKCRPPGNRNPEPEEIAACHPFLMAQLAVLRPQVICTLGNVPLRALFGPDIAGITRVRGQRRDWQGIPVIPTFHPSYLLRNESGKKPAWDDLKAVLTLLGRTPPAPMRREG